MRVGSLISGWFDKVGSFWFDLHCCVELCLLYIKAKTENLFIINITQLLLFCN